MLLQGELRFCASARSLARALTKAGKGPSIAMVIASEGFAQQPQALVDTPASASRSCFIVW